MKTRFTLTSLALASLMMMGNAAMADVVPTGTSKAFNVKLKLAGVCEIFTVTSGKTDAISAADDPTAGADIDFGSQTANQNADLTQSNVGQVTSGIEVKCSKNTAFAVALEPGNGSNDGKGALGGLQDSNQDQIAYQLLKPTVSNAGLATETVDNVVTTNKWGTGTNALSLTGKGLGKSIMLPVFAKISAGELSDKTPDTYHDRVKVTLTY